MNRGRAAAGRARPRCLLCARRSHELICGACRDRVQAEALRGKLEIQRKGGL